jgi:hypothetical protein
MSGNEILTDTSWCETCGEGVVPGICRGRPKSETSPYLFVAETDDRTHVLTWCDNEAEILEAVIGVCYFVPEGEELDPEDLETCKAHVAALLEDGFVNFEGDPGLQLLKIHGRQP